MSLLPKIRIGTRDSSLALSQAHEVKKILLESCNIKEEQIDIIKIKTSGDKIQDRSLAEIGGKGLFIKELEESLIKNDIDFAVHSAKDVPPELHHKTIIAAFTKRKNPQDYFLSNKYDSIKDLPTNSVIGTSSPRRKAILLKIRPDLKVVNFRGNVETRIKKLNDEVVDATILAVCGLERLERKLNPEKVINIEEMLPPAGQGSLILQASSNNSDILSLLKNVNDNDTAICVVAERKFLQLIGASCKTPVSSYCEYSNKTLKLQISIFDFDGKNFFAKTVFGKSADEVAILAAESVKKDAKKLLEKIIMN